MTRKKVYPDNSIGVRLLEEDNLWVRTKAADAGLKPGTFLRELVVSVIDQDRRGHSEAQE